MRDPSHVCNLHHSSRQCQILNPLRGARDRTRILMDPSRLCFQPANFKVEDDLGSGEANPHVRPPLRWLMGRQMAEEKRLEEGPSVNGRASQAVPPPSNHTAAPSSADNNASGRSPSPKPPSSLQMGLRHLFSDALPLGRGTASELSPRWHPETTLTHRGTSGSALTPYRGPWLNLHPPLPHSTGPGSAV